MNTDLLHIACATERDKNKSTKMKLIFKEDDYEVYYTYEKSNPYSVFLKKEERLILKYRCKVEEDARVFIKNKIQR